MQLTALNKAIFEAKDSAAIQRMLMIVIYAVTYEDNAYRLTLKINLVMHIMMLLLMPRYIIVSDGEYRVLTSVDETAL